MRKPKGYYCKIAVKNHHPFSMKALEEIQAINRECNGGFELMADLDYLNVLDSLFELAYKLGKESK